MRQAHGDGHFASIAFVEFRCLIQRQQQHKTREIFWIILDIFGKDNTAVLLGGTPASDTSIRFVTTSEDFANASGGIFRRNTLQVRMREEEAFALSERHWMRSHGTKISERPAGTSDQLMFNSKNSLGRDRELTL